MTEETETAKVDSSAQDKSGGISATSDTSTPSTPRDGRDWLALLILAGGAGALLWSLISALGAGWGLWGWRSGFTGVTWSFFLALATLALGGLLIWLRRRKGTTSNRLALYGGMALALFYAGWITSYIIKARSVPAIHDISTDLADPPQFAVLTLREDNWDAIPGDDRDELRGLNPQQRWRVIHQEAYGAIRSVRIDQPMPEVIAKAERLARDRGWDIAVIRPEEGRMEATATSSLFRFKDDVVLRVRPAENGAGSIVDMRSVSRVGQSDLGVNAERIRRFLADLSGTVTAQ